MANNINSITSDGSNKTGQKNQIQKNRKALSKYEEDINKYFLKIFNKNIAEYFLKIIITGDKNKLSTFYNSLKVQSMKIEFISQIEKEK